MEAGASGASNAIDGTADGRPGIDVMVLASSSSCSSSTSMARRLVTSSGTAWRSRASMEYSATSVPVKAVCEISGICTWNTAVPSTSMNGLENCGTCVLRAAVKAASEAVLAPWRGSDGSSALLRRLAAPRKIEPRKVARGVRSAFSQITCVSSGRVGAKLAVWVKKLSVSTSWVTMSRVRRTISSWSSLRRPRICCWATSVSRRTASVARSISSLRSVQNAATIAARNRRTETSGPKVAKRSWRAADWLRHQRPNRRCVHDGDGVEPDSWAGCIRALSSSWRGLLARLREISGPIGPSEIHNVKWSAAI